MGATTSTYIAFSASPIFDAAVGLSCGLDTAPADVLAHLAQFLVGSDVLRLSMCDSRLHAVLTDDAVWRPRLPLSKAVSNVKQRYGRASSLLLRGSRAGSEPATTAGIVDSVPMPLGIFPRHRDISFDMWFALVQPLDATTLTGGVLVGAQDMKASRSEADAARYSESFAFVDEHRHLHCSLLMDKPVIAKALQFYRWYHLALTYDHADHRQSVFLDGEMVHTTRGATQWPWFHHAQLGAGYEADGDTGRRQWRGFRGLVDEFRICYSAWTPLQVQRLALGKRTNAPMAYTLSRDLCRCKYARSGSWLEVKCTRPMERQVEITGVCDAPAASATRRLNHAVTTACARRGKSQSTDRSIWQLMRQCL